MTNQFIGLDFKDFAQTLAFICATGCGVAVYAAGQNCQRHCFWIWQLAAFLMSLVWVFAFANILVDAMKLVGLIT